MSRYSVRGIVVSVLIVAAFVAVCAVVLSGRSQKPVYTYELGSAPAVTSEVSDKYTYVYYAEDSELWHADKDCPLLADEQVIYECTPDYAASTGRSQCGECAG